MRKRWFGDREDDHYTTTSTGAFTVKAPAGTYLLTVGSNSTYATLRERLTANPGPNSLGTLKVAALSADEQAWLVDVNTQRATISVPKSLANLSIYPSMNSPKSRPARKPMRSPLATTRMAMLPKDLR